MKLVLNPSLERRQCPLKRTSSSVCYFNESFSLWKLSLNFILTGRHERLYSKIYDVKIKYSEL